MSRIYTSSNKIRFTEISEKYKVVKSQKGKLSEMHAMLITYVSKHFQNTRAYKQQVVDALNIITYAAYANDPLPFNWTASNPFVNMPEIDESLIEDTLTDVFLTIDSIDWNIPAIDDSCEQDAVEAKRLVTPAKNTSKPKAESKPKKPVKPVEPARRLESSLATPKTDLYIQSPAIPRFDYSKKWAEGNDANDHLVIYSTLPIIPTKQNEISCTTDVNSMTVYELMRLFPNTFIRTRASVMYEPVEGLEYDNDLGVILPIGHYTHNQLVDNLIRYPHIFRLIRQLPDDNYKFYTHIEIDGELKGTLDVWKTLPDTQKLPFHAEYIKEYVVRRYLLERDIDKIEHKYPIYGTLEPFLTLFMTPDDYINRGFQDIEGLAKQCVISRVSYKQSRNPILRRLSTNG